MKFLITGATGYIGHHLSEHLLEQQADVHALVRPSSDISRLEQIGLPIKIHPVATDGLGDMAPLLKVMAEVQPDCIFHLASDWGGAADTAFSDIIQSNIIMTAALLEAASTLGTSRFVNVGSYWQFNEQGAVAPNGLYAASKQAAHDLMSHYVLNRGLKAATVILYDVYGPGDWRKKLTHILFQSLQVPQQTTRGEQLLDMLFIDDAIAALVDTAAWLKEDFSISETVPLFFAGTGKLSSLRTIAGIFGRTAGADVMLEWGAIPYRDGQIFHPCPPNPTVPGWQPKVPLEAGLQRVLQASLN